MRRYLASALFFIVFGERVGGIVNTGEGFEIEVRISLCGGNAAVAEQLLNAAQICPPFQKMGGKRMTEVVGGKMLWYSSVL